MENTEFGRLACACGRATRQDSGIMGRTVIAKNQAIVLVLTMIAVVEWDERIVCDNDSLVDLQQMARSKRSLTRKFSSF